MALIPKQRAPLRMEELVTLYKQAVAKYSTKYHGIPQYSSQEFLDEVLTSACRTRRYVKWEQKPEVKLTVSQQELTMSCHERLTLFLQRESRTR
jgi:hypothetical protein